MSEHESALRGLNEISCLKSSGGVSIYLCQRENERCIVKVTESPEEAELLRNEYEMLSLIAASSHPLAKQFPQPLEFRDQPPYTLIRSYIPGHSLETLVEAQPDQPGLPRETAVACTREVLKQLAFLHSLRPPVIHRDIKPQNVIVDAEGGAHLIDLGISRVYRREKDTMARRRGNDVIDTRVIGTRLTAPPEQFGYRQTDERSDIYSAGVLLRYCLTGEYAQDADGTVDPDLRAVIRKATAFDPDNRYQRTEQMTAALDRKNGKRKRGPARWAIALIPLLLLAALAAWFLLPKAPSPVHFREPLIEQAARAQLHRPEGDLFKEDLAQVKSIHIIGRQIYDNESQIWFQGPYIYMRNNTLREAGLWEENGGISSLDDLRLMSNLEEVCLYRQQISDLSALRGAAIPRIGIGDNPITDLSPLAGNRSITYLNLNNLPIDPLPVVVTLPALDTLVASGTKFSSFNGLKALPLRELNLFSSGFGIEWWPIAEISTLQSITISKLDWHILDVLKATEIADLTIAESNGVPLKELEALPQLRNLYFYQTGSGQPIGGAPLEFPNLFWADFKNFSFDSCACFAHMQSLEILNIYASSFESFDGLDALTALKSIYCTAEQAEKIRTQYPSAPWELYY